MDSAGKATVNYVGGNQTGMTDVQVVGLRGDFSFEDAVEHFTGMGGEVEIGRAHV